MVTGALGLSWYDCIWTGQDAHAGPTPMEARHDALRGAARFVEAINALAMRHAPDGRATVGFVQVSPNSRNVIPGLVKMTVDMRHPDDEDLATMDRELRAAAAAIARELRLECDLQQVDQRNSRLEAKFSRSRASERRQHGAAAQCLAEVMGERAHVEAGRDLHLQPGGLAVERHHLEALDGDRHRLGALCDGGLAPPRQVGQILDLVSQIDQRQIGRGILRLLLTRVIRGTLPLLVGVRMADANVPFKLFRRRLWDEAKPLIPPDTLAPSLFLAIFAAARGYRIAIVPVPHRERQTGVVSIRRWKLFKFCAKAFGQLVEFRRRLHA